MLTVVCIVALAAAVRNSVQNIAVSISNEVQSKTDGQHMSIIRRISQADIAGSTFHVLDSRPGIHENDGIKNQIIAPFDDSHHYHNALTQTCNKESPLMSSEVELFNSNTTNTSCDQLIVQESQSVDVPPLSSSILLALYNQEVSSRLAMEYELKNEILTLHSELNRIKASAQHAELNAVSKAAQNQILYLLLLNSHNSLQRIQGMFVISFQTISIVGATLLLLFSIRAACNLVRKKRARLKATKQMKAELKRKRLIRGSPIRSA